MSDDAKRAKAAAKAAKAEAKALRPFYKKKRWWTIGVIAIIAIISATSGGGSTPSNTDNAEAGGSTENTVSTGLGSKDASADIVSIDCGSPDSIGVTYSKVTIKNNSSKPSDYFVTVVYESADGSMRYDSTIASAMNINPGQSTVAEGMIMEEIPAGAVCKVSEVQRTASN
jgi:hypothetical protein